MWEAVGQTEQKGKLRAGESVADEIKGRILIVDDDDYFVRVLQRILSGEHFAVEATSNPCEAMGLLHSSNFDLIICDLRMPDCDGLNLLQSIRRDGNKVPVIILTAYGDVDTYLEAMNSGATEYLNKPTKSDELLSVVRNCLRKDNHRRNSRLPDNTQCVPF